MQTILSVLFTALLSGAAYAQTMQAQAVDMHDPGTVYELYTDRRVVLVPIAHGKDSFIHDKSLQVIESSKIKEDADCTKTLLIVEKK